VVETFNAKLADAELLTKAEELAAELDLPAAAGSDAHDPQGIGAAYLEMPDFDGPSEFLAALSQATRLGHYFPHAPRLPWATHRVG
jgi:hypothetical protein